MPRKMTHEEQVASISKINPDIEVIGKIINNNTKVLCRCKICDHKWSPTPNHLKSGCGCPKCGRLKATQKLTLSHEEHVAAITNINPDIEVLGRITSAIEKVLCRCKVCDHKWSPRPYAIKNGQGCPKCARLKVAQRQTLSHEEQVAAIAKINPDIEVIGKITGSMEKVLCRCKVCDHEWMATPSDLKRGRGCPKCAGKMKLSHEEQVAVIAKVNPNVEILGEIKKDKTKVLCRCKICDHKWMITPNSLKNGQGCPKCAKHGFLHHKHGKLYIMVDDLEVPTVMKVGVSVKENERRNQILRSAHKAGVRIPNLHIVKTLEGPTENIHELESTMHKAFSNYKINFPVKFDGSNEFFYYRPEVFDVVEEAYKGLVCCQ
ncbi:TPA: zinc-ribbon domain-containing protein [Escherichia coli]